jgi:hypothetical protein
VTVPTQVPVAMSWSYSVASDWNSNFMPTRCCSGCAPAASTVAAVAGSSFAVGGRRFFAVGAAVVGEAKGVSRGPHGCGETCNHLPHAVGIEPATYDRALVEQRATLTIGPPAERRLTDFEY